MSQKAKTLLFVAGLVAGLVLVSLQSDGLRKAVAAPSADVACTNHLLNSSFETDDVWSLPVTAYRAVYSTEQAYDGNRSMRVGIVNATENGLSYSSATQTILLPTGSQTATLSLQWYPLSTEGDLAGPASADEPVDPAIVQAVADGVAPAAALAGDRQYVLLLNEQNTVLARLRWTRSDARSWQALHFDLTPYAGQTLRVLFGVYNDGIDGVTATFVDDATLLTCPPSAAVNYLPMVANELTPTPTLISPSPSPTPSPTPSATVVWSDPDQAIEVFSPVSAGLYHSPIVVNGFSRTFEGAVNLRLTDKDGQVLAERHTQGGSVDGFAFFDSYLRFTVSEMISGTLEVFEASAKDGSEINKVTRPVVLLPGQPVIDLNQPTVGQQVCDPLFVQGYSNTFEANVAVTLNQRNGTQLALATAMGGNLGLYADFSTLISQTVTAPQPVLVSAYEESPAGFGLIDETRIPVALYPSGSGGCP